MKTTHHPEGCQARCQEEESISAVLRSPFFLFVFTLSGRASAFGSSDASQGFDGTCVQGTRRRVRANSVGEVDIVACHLIEKVSNEQL